MTLKRGHIFAVAGAMLFAVGAGALFSGCKGNPTEASTGGQHVGPPPNVTVLKTAVDPGGKNPGGMNPLVDKVWLSAAWYTLTPPANTTKSTPAVRAAMLYDDKNLYVAFVSDTVPPPAAPILQDSVSVFLDSTPDQDGKEMAQVAVNSTGQYSCTWIRSSEPAMKKEDGGPDWLHPYATVPNVAVKGLAAQVAAGMQNGSPVWTAVVTIPVMNLPLPFQQQPAAGVRWKLNLIRSISTKDMGQGTEQLQANLSQVYLGAQVVSPYRMARVLLAGDAGGEMRR